MPTNDITVPSNNYNFIKILRTGCSPLTGAIGIGSYYGQLLSNPILGSINSLLFAKKLGIDIYNLNQRPNFKTRLLNSSKKILLGLGTISIANYSKFVNEIIEPIIPTTNPIPFTTSTINPNITTTTDIPPWPPELLLSENNTNTDSFIDFNTYISLNAFGASNIISGIIEVFANNNERLKKICDITSGSSLISAGISMGINNGFNNASAIPTIISGASEIINSLLPLETEHNNTEMQETSFTQEHESLLNQENRAINYGSNSSLNSEIIIFDRTKNAESLLNSL